MCKSIGKKMRLVNTEDNFFGKKMLMVLPVGQVIFLLGLLCIGSILISMTMLETAVNTILFFFFVAVFGLFQCRRTQIKLKDSSLKILGYFWLLKLGIMFFLLYFGWIPQLDPAVSSVWGYDPQRFYLVTQHLIDGNWYIGYTPYIGIIYYYAAFLFALGRNPVIPALVNVFVTLIASLYLIRVCYEIKGERARGDWIIAFCLLLPEILWFDVMTSRETLMGALLIFAMLPAGRYFARIGLRSFFRSLIIVLLSGMAIIAIRPIMVWPVFMSLGLMMFLVKPVKGEKSLKPSIFVFTFVAVLMASIVIPKVIGGYEFEVSTIIRKITMASENNVGKSTGEFWTENSIGRLLLPNGFFESLVFLPARMILYLLAPLPNIFVSISGLVNGSCAAWQKLMFMSSSVVNTILFPYALASLVQSFKTRKKNSAPLILHFSYWMVFLAVAGGNLIIHERYRVMASLLLWACAWLGMRTCSKKLIFGISFFWYGLLSLGALFYVIYKFGFV